MSNNENIIRLTRDCMVVLIPHGDEIELKKDTEVMITQSLGGSATLNYQGNLVRVSSENLDALGIASENLNKATDAISGSDTVDLDQIWETLRTCYDPEIPINIVELGLIYRCELVPYDGGDVIEIDMTLTAPGCGMGPFLVEDVRSKVSVIPNVKKVEVELVFDPPWRPDMMSEEARLEAGLY